MRHIVIDVMEEAYKRHCIHGIFECEVTKAKKLLAEYHKKTGTTVSFTAYLIYVISRAVDKHKLMQGIRVGSKVYIFNDVDVNTIVERQTLEGEYVPCSIIIRRANYKGILEIHEEIRGAQSAELHGTSLGSGKEAKKTNLMASLPKILRKLLWWKVRHDPLFRKQNLGTMNVSCVGVFAKNAVGYPLTQTPWPLQFSVGGFSQRQWITETKDVELHEYLHITCTLDHDVVDGGPGARFLRFFADSMADAVGLDDLLKVGQ